jgi:hypothetical protein
MSLLGKEVRDENFEMGRVASRTFGTIGRNAVTFFSLGVLAVAPQLILSAYLGVGVFAKGQAVDPSKIINNLGLFFLVSVFAVVLTAVLQAALVHGTISDLNGKKASFGECLQTGFRYALPVIGLSILFSFAMVFGLVLLVVPGVLIMLAWSVAVPVLVVEQTGVFGAFGRSAELTKGHRWAILGLGLVFWIISVIIGLALAPLDSMLILSGEGISSMALVLLVNGIVNVLTTTIMAAGVAAIYYELRSIKEGIGPEQLAAVFD